MQIGGLILQGIAWFLFVGYLESHSPTPSGKMPSQWDRRYYRVNDSKGEEVLLIKKAAGRGAWYVVRPDNSIAKLDTSKQITVKASPLNGVAYSPVSPMAAPMRAMLVAQADQAAAGTLVVPTLPQFQPGRRGWLRALLVLGAWPAQCGTYLRWCLRSKWRALGLVVVLYIASEVMDALGIWNFARSVYGVAESTIDQARVVAGEVEGAWSSMWAAAEMAWAFLSFFGDPLNVLWYSMLGLVLLRAFGDVGEEESSPTSSAASSENGTPPETPRMGDIIGVMEVKGLLERQMAVIETLKEEQMALREGVELARERYQADHLLKDAEEERRAAWRATDRQEIQALARKVDEFRSALGKGSTSSGSFERIGAEIEVDETPAPASPGAKLDASVQEAIHRMQRKAELPQAVFLEALKSWKEVPGWNDHFPVGYRTRVAGEFLSEVYGGGDTGERWARSYIAQKNAAKSHAIKELIPTMIAIDTMILVDRDPGVINRVSLEKLCRKAMGLVEAWRKVEVESDWNRPSGASKSWKSKVAYDEAKRIDPSMADENMFKIRKLEDEVRAETEREAGLLKARLKIEKHKAEE